MSDVNVNALLYRKIQPGNQYNKLIPQPKGEKVYSGNGDTDFSIKEMVEVINDCSWQMEKVAKILQSSSLIDNIDNVKEFIFNHFQYKADEEDQLLRSPSYAWHIDRQSGIDCKTFSILASCLLTEMGIIHYIRKIKQPAFAPTEWTHVYIVVPVDQQKGDLNKGYYTIDGTLKEDYEPAFLQASDYFMSLKHYRLNAPATPLNGGISFNDIKGLVNGLDCLGGSAYKPSTLTNNLPKINQFFQGLIDNINNAVKNGDDTAFAESVCDYFGFANVLVKGSEKKATEGWNSCSTNVIKGHTAAYKYYRDTVGSVLKEWLNQYFVKDNSVAPVGQTFNTNDVNPFRNLPINELGAVSQNVTYIENLVYYDPKNNVPIKKLEVPLYDKTTMASGTFNPIQFIAGLSTILASFGTDDVSGNPTNPDNSTTNTIGNNATTSQMGFGTIGWLFLGSAIVWGITSRQKNNPKSKTTK